MTETGLVDAIAAVIGGDKAGAKKMAKIFVSGAITKVGRTPNVDFNRGYVEFTLKSTVKKYTIGATLLSGWANLWNMQDLHHTDTLGYPIAIYKLTRFNSFARGGTSSGRPKIATIHSHPAILEVYPNPDKDYKVEAYIPRKITVLADIPADFHDVVETIALSRAAAYKEPEIALALAGADLKELRSESKTGWQGSIPAVDMPLYTGDGRRGRATTKNLTAE